jgi:tetratricopeptide (TPR) repeat protein
MLKDMLLLIIGGGVTFAVTLLIGKLSRHRPRLTWRLLPPVHLSSQGLTAFNVVLANQGNDAATNVQVVVELPEDAQIESVEIEPSETALRYEMSVYEDRKNRIGIEFPKFQSNLDCVLSFLAHKKELKDIDVSITADPDVLGEADSGISRETLNRYRRRLTQAYAGMTGVIIFSALCIIVWKMLLGTGFNDSLQQMAIGDVYYNSGDYQRALVTYTAIGEGSLKPFNSPVKYRMAQAYAQLSKSASAVSCLEEILRKGDPELAAFSAVDPAFGPIWATGEYTELKKQLVSRKVSP